MKYYLLIIFNFLALSIEAQTLTFFNSERLILGIEKERTASMSLGDIDNDGDIDALVANGRHWPGPDVEAEDHAAGRAVDGPRATAGGRNLRNRRTSGPEPIPVFDAAGRDGCRS